MPNPVFTTNDTEVVRLEGMYIKERSVPAAIKGVARNGVSFIGTAVKGPVGKRVQITNPADFFAIFGERDYKDGSAFVSDLWRSLQNKRFGVLWVERVAAAAAVKATKNFLQTATPIITVNASSPGKWGLSVTVQVLAATDANVNHFDLIVTDGQRTQRYKNLDVSGTNDNTATVIGTTDDSRMIDVVKLAAGRPDVIAATALLSGADGTIADSDYTVANGPMDRQATAPNTSFCTFAGYMSTAIKARAATLSAAATDRVWLVGANDETVTKAAAVTDAALNRNDRLWYFFNAPQTLDPNTAQLMWTPPWVWAAGIFSQIDVDIHIGDADNAPYLSGIVGVYNQTLVRQDFIDLKDAGICALEMTDDGPAFVSGVTTSLQSGKEQQTRRRMADYLLLSVADGLRWVPKKKNTPTVRRRIKGSVVDFLQRQKEAERVVAAYSVDNESVNNATDRGNGIERLLMKVDTVDHILSFVIEGEIGTNVTITEVAA
jgi:hypothetical protein